MEVEGTREGYWAEHIRGWKSGGLSQAAYCAQHDLKVASLSYWLGKERRQREGLTLVALPLGGGAGGPVLHGKNGWRLELPAQVEPDWLAELLRRLP